jgi:hypothetical protein
VSDEFTLRNIGPSPVFIQPLDRSVQPGETFSVSRQFFDEVIRRRIEAGCYPTGEPYPLVVVNVTLAPTQKAPTTIAGEFDLHDDAAVREKLTVMTKWEAMMDDGRNSGDIFGDLVEVMLKPGKRYRVTVQTLGPIEPPVSNSKDKDDA